MDVLVELDIRGILSSINLVADNLVEYLHGLKWNIPGTYYKKKFIE